MTSRTSATSTKRSRLTLERRLVAAAGVEALVEDIRDFARYFCAMALGAETDAELKRGLP